MKLNTLLKTLGFLALAATPVVAGTAPAPKGPAPIQPPVNDDLGVNVGLGYHTNLIWRGLNFGQNWVNGIGMATPIAHKGVVAGAKVQAMTLLDLMTDDQLMDEAWDYFRNVQSNA